MTPYSKKLQNLADQHGGYRALARLTGYNESNIRRWAQGKVAMPADVALAVMRGKRLPKKSNLCK